MHAQVFSKVAVPSPWGTIIIICSDLGIARVDLPTAQPELTRQFLERYFGRHKFIREVSPLAAYAKEELQDYLAGSTKTFDSPLDVRLTPFATRVLQEAAQIPYGTTMTYGQLAAKVNNPKASRAVGWSMAHNPIPLFIPCHRVLPASGGIGQYGGGSEMKKALLALEEQRRQ